MFEGRARIYFYHIFIMSKQKIIYQCQTCGHSASKWLGKCPDCGAWNSFIEERTTAAKPLKTGTGGTAVTLTDIQINKEDSRTTGIGELDRVLGGGIVSGMVVLIGGDPGIGKSTIVLQMLDGLLKNTEGNGGSALYVSGEESLKQIKLRSQRLEINNSKIKILSETCVDTIIKYVKDTKPSVLVVDSIQTVFLQDLPSAPGSVGQVRESAYQLMQLAKQTHLPVFIIGHVTKEGAIAGPRVLEHIVDTVLYFEGERGYSYRILRAVKNRFGSTNEIGVFDMREKGLIEITNPSELFLDQNTERLSGTVAVATIEGTRPLIVELQALVSRTSFGIPRRTGIGVDINRVNLLIAVLEKIGGMHLGDCDVFINVVGGLKIIEPAFDMGIISAIVSSHKNITIKKDIIVFGEVGLSGEIRAVSQAEARIKEGTKIGFKEAVIPASNLNRLSYKPEINITGVKNIEEALQHIINY